MSRAMAEIVRVLGKHRADLADEIYDRLDVAGYLIEPNEPLVIELERRAVTHETQLADGIDLLWNSDAVVGIRLNNGFGVRSA